MSTWVASECTNLDLGDERLNRRAIKIIASIANSPQSSIPKSSQGWAETQATYRFYANDSVTHTAILEAHYEATKTRMRASASPVILCIQDTTELDFNGQLLRTNLNQPKTPVLSRLI